MSDVRPIVAGGPVDVQVVAADYAPVLLRADDDAEEDEVLVGGEDLVIHGDHLDILLLLGGGGAAEDAEVGDARRPGGEEGDLDLRAAPGICDGGGVVAAVGDVGSEFEERRRDRFSIAAGVEGRRMQT